MVDAAEQDDGMGAPPAGDVMVSGEFVRAHVEKIDQQGRDLGAKDEEIERLNRLVRHLNDQLQARTSELQNTEDALKRTCEVANRAKDDQLQMGRKVDELATALRRSEDANATLRMALHALNVDKKAAS